MLTDPHTIAKGLTKAQRVALMHPNAGGSAYGWAKMPTLDALYSRGLVGKKAGLGAMFLPHTAIKWPLRPLGLAVRQALKEMTDGSE